LRPDAVETSLKNPIFQQGFGKKLPANFNIYPPPASGRISGAGGEQAPGVLVKHGPLPAGESSFTD